MSRNEQVVVPAILIDPPGPAVARATCNATSSELRLTVLEAHLGSKPSWACQLLREGRICSD